MANSLCIALAQLNPVVGDILGNQALILAAHAEGNALGADLIICPELVICGYPPEDLVLRPAFVASCQRAVAQIALATKTGPAIILTSPWDGGRARPYNAAMLLADGKIAATRYKQALPNYSVFDEPRTFCAGPETTPIEFCGLNIGLLVCEDMWAANPAKELAAKGADVLIVPHGSPYRDDIEVLRHDEACARVKETGLPLIFVNQVGGQDELVFDGAAFVLTPTGEKYCAPQFQSGVVLTQWEKTTDGWACRTGPQEIWRDGLARTYDALVCGTRDYVQKSGFSSVILGLSGGIDSAIVAAIAVDALGADNVHCVMLPARFTSDNSLEDAKACAKALGVRYDIVDIEPGVDALGAMLGPMFTGCPEDVTEENIQSRLRGVALMAISNKFGAMVLTTGNKSEMAVGYATLYGDMNGGYNPIKDVYKTQVFALARWRNANLPQGGGITGEVIPERIITKPPSAELREDQKDEDSLPPYDVLDDILHGLIEQEASVDDICLRGHDGALVRHIQKLLYRAEYKRRQSAPGPKITSRNFGRDRRYPIVNRWSE